MRTLHDRWAASGLTIDQLADEASLSRMTVKSALRGMRLLPENERKIVRAIEKALRARARELQRLGVIEKSVKAAESTPAA
jgi:lambda repressor-like predicted transcriptional regulator